jgi:hypothetical protein
VVVLVKTPSEKEARQYICTNGYTTNVDITTNYEPPSRKVLETWLVDDSFEGSGYVRSMGKISASRTLGFQEIMTNCKLSIQNARISRNND